MASIVTHIYALSGSTFTTTISLPSLTITFTPPSQCHPSILWSSSATAIPGQATMQIWDDIEATTAVGIVAECWPSNLPAIYARGNGWDDVLALAYPGTICMSGWTTACTTTLEWSSSQYTQTWCCPSSFVCHSGNGDFGCYRCCLGHLSTSTSVWTFDNVLKHIGSTTLSAVPQDKPYNLVRWPLPLMTVEARETLMSNSRLSTSETRSATTSSPTTAYGVTSTSSPNLGSSGLSSGAIAGIAVGSTAAGFIILGALAFFLWCNVHRKRPGDRAAVSDGFPEFKPELDATSTGRPSTLPAGARPTQNQNQIPELYGGAGERAELQ